MPEFLNREGSPGGLRPTRFARPPSCRQPSPKIAVDCRIMSSAFSLAVTTRLRSQCTRLDASISTPFVRPTSQGNLRPPLLTMVIDSNLWRRRRVFLTGHTGFKGCWLSLMLARLNAQTMGYALAPSSDRATANSDASRTQIPI
jgi:hypothetical protein